MNANRLIPKLAEVVRESVYQARMDFYDKVNEEIIDARQRESVASTPEDKQFHKGVHVGMMHVLIMLDKIEI